MDICFVGQGDYREFLEETAPEVFEPGLIVDLSGNELGEHSGIAGFTIGQRRGLGVAVGEPRFVQRIEPETATIVLAGRDDLTVSGVELDKVTWTSGEGVSGNVMAQYRAHGNPVPAIMDGDRLTFSSPQEAVAPGQTVAFYEDERVLGGGLIADTFL